MQSLGSLRIRFHSPLQLSKMLIQEIDETARIVKFILCNYAI